MLEMLQIGRESAVQGHTKSTGSAAEQLFTLVRFREPRGLNFLIYEMGTVKYGPHIVVVEIW